MGDREANTPPGAVTDPFIQHVAASLLDSIEPLTDEMVRRVVAEDPFFAQASARSHDDVRADVKENLGQILRGLAGHEPLDFDLARNLARHRAEQGVPVAAMLHAYRVAAQVLWDHHVAAGHVLGMSQFDLDQVLDGAAELWTLTNTYCSVISQAYDDVATDRARRSERTRMLVLDALLDGRVDDLPPLAEMSRLLDLPEREPFVVVVAEVLPPAQEGIPNVDHVLRHAGLRSTWRLFRHRQIGVVVVGADEASVTSLCDLLGNRTLARVGLSPVYTDLTDTARQVGLAGLALSCSPPGHKAVLRFEQHPVGVLVARSPELSERIATKVLGPLLALEPNDRDLLLDTLTAWFESGGSVASCSERLYCHRNTVRNRLQRIETSTGRSLADPVGSAELYVATTAARLTLDLAR